MLLISSVLSTLVGCRDYDPSAELMHEEAWRERPYFDFSLTSQILLDVDYGPTGAGALVCLYEGSLQVDDNNRPAEGQHSLFSIFLDEQGRFSDTICLTHPIADATLYSPSWLTPDEVWSRVHNGSLTFTDTPLPPLYTGMTRAGEGGDDNTGDYIVRLLSESDRLYCIADWDPTDHERCRFGGWKTDNNGLYGYQDPSVKSAVTGKSLNDYIAAMNTIVTRNVNPSTGSVDNSSFSGPTKDIDNYIATSGVDPTDGVTKTVEYAEVELVVMKEDGNFTSSFGYYYYIGDQPKDPKDIDKYIIFPNTSQNDNTPFGGSSDWRKRWARSEKAPVRQGTTVKLLYKDPESDKYTTHFPPGTTIGYFLIPDAFDAPWSGDWNYKKDESGEKSSYIENEDPYLSLTQTTSLSKPLRRPADMKEIYKVNNTYWRYSDCEWNENTNAKRIPDYGNKRCTYMALVDKDKNLYFGSEDGVDNTYDDFMFMIHGTPKYAINIPQNRNDIDKVIEKITNPETHTEKSGVISLAFEDQWPVGGDYDLNDVIVEHHRDITMDIHNCVTEVKDYYTLSTKSRATYCNAFAIRLEKYNSVNPKTTTVVDGNGNAIGIESETDSYIIFNNTVEQKGKTVVVTRTYNPEKVHRTHIKAQQDFAPYLIAKYDENPGQGRTEIHLPGGTPSKLANAEAANGYYASRFVSEDGQHPFAIVIPASFSPSPEGVVIDQTYPRFTSWCKSGGKEDTDWYQK